MGEVLQSEALGGVGTNRVDASAEHVGEGGNGREHVSERGHTGCVARDMPRCEDYGRVGREGGSQVVRCQRGEWILADGVWAVGTWRRT